MKMKKFLILLLISVLMVTGCFDNKYTTTVEISYEEYKEKIDNNESFALLIWRTGCAHCETFEPKLDEVISKYNLKIYSLDISDLEEVEYEKLKNKTFVSGTPSTVIFEKGKKKDKLVGDKDKDTIIKFFKTNGYIGE